jgi:hypothetical protein
MILKLQEKMWKMRQCGYRRVRVSVRLLNLAVIGWFGGVGSTWFVGWVGWLFILLLRVD